MNWLKNGSGKCLPCWGRGRQPRKRGQQAWGAGSCPTCGLSRTWSPGEAGSTGPKYPSDQTTLLGTPSLAPASLQVSLRVGLSETVIPLVVGGGPDCPSSSLRPTRVTFPRAKLARPPQSPTLLWLPAVLSIKPGTQGLCDLGLANWSGLSLTSSLCPTLCGETPISAVPQTGPHFPSRAPEPSQCCFLSGQCPFRTSEPLRPLVFTPRFPLPGMPSQYVFSQPSKCDSKQPPFLGEGSVPVTPFIYHGSLCTVVSRAETELWGIY